MCDLPEIYKEIHEMFRDRAYTADEIVDAMAHRFGGLMCYFNTLSSYTRALQNREIVARFDGHNQKELAVRYGVSEQHVYRLLKTRRELLQKGKQHGLPGME